MRSDMTPQLQCNHLNRRSFLRVAGIATAVGLLSASPVGRLAFAAALSRAQRETLTPDEIIALMRKGNERFRRGEETPHDYLAQQRASARPGITVL
jgi:carbonic anhydrase